MGYIEKEDYDEQRCLLCMDEDKPSVPIGRIIEKLDEYFSKNDVDGAKRHLKYWLGEAEDMSDERGKLTLLNELAGLCRKQGEKDDAIMYAEAALNTAEALEMQNTVSFATTLINLATVYKAFGMAEKAMPHYRKAEKIYIESLKPGDERLGGLYNNMALALMDLKEYGEAREAFLKAEKISEEAIDGKPQAAISYLNLATLTENELGLDKGEKQIAEYLDKAMVLLDDKDNKQDGNYAYVCEKCATVFGYYGYFLYEKELSDRSRSIYERA